MSVAKAGLSASLAARTTVMAAANPVSGHYNRAKTVNENLKMSAAILSRFDLLYILIDRQDDLQDRDNTRQVKPVCFPQRYPDACAAAMASQVLLGDSLPPPSASVSIPQTLVGDGEKSRRRAPDAHAGGLAAHGGAASNSVLHADPVTTFVDGAAQAVPAREHAAAVAACAHAHLS